MSSQQMKSQVGREHDISDRQVDSSPDILRQDFHPFVDDIHRKIGVHKYIIVSHVRFFEKEKIYFCK